MDPAKSAETLLHRNREKSKAAHRGRLANPSRNCRPLAGDFLEQFLVDVEIGVHVLHVVMFLESLE